MIYMQIVPPYLDEHLTFTFYFFFNINLTPHAFWLLLNVKLPKLSQHSNRWHVDSHVSFFFFHNFLDFLNAKKHAISNSINFWVTYPFKKSITYKSACALGNIKQFFIITIKKVGYISRTSPALSYGLYSFIYSGPIVLGEKDIRNTIIFVWRLL